MANQFGFQMSEDFLQAYANYLKQLRMNNPGKSYKVVLNVDLIPDGIGYQITAPPQITIEEDEAAVVSTPSDEQIRDALHHLPSIDFPPGLPSRIQQLLDTAEKEKKD